MHGHPVFFQNFSEEERAIASRNEFNFDHPDAFDYELLVETLKNLKRGKSVEIPIYSFKFHRREKQKVHFNIMLSAKCQLGNCAVFYVLLLFMVKIIILFSVDTVEPLRCGHCSLVTFMLGPEI